MLVEVTLLVSGFIGSNCYRDMKDSARWDTGYIESKQVQSLEPRGDCKGGQFCTVNFADNADHDHSRFVTVKGSCGEVAKKLRGK